MTATLNTEGVVTLSKSEVLSIVKFVARLVFWEQGQADNPFAWMTDARVREVESRCAQLYRAILNGRLLVRINIWSWTAEQALQERVTRCGAAAAAELLRRQGVVRREPAPLPTRQQALDFMELFVGSLKTLEV